MKNGTHFGFDRTGDFIGPAAEDHIQQVFKAAIVLGDLVRRKQDGHGQDQDTEREDGKDHGKRDIAGAFQPVFAKEPARRVLERLKKGKQPVRKVFHLCIRARSGPVVNRLDPGSLRSSTLSQIQKKQAAAAK